jgi:hypothetical protein
VGGLVATLVILKRGQVGGIELRMSVKVVKSMWREECALNFERVEGFVVGN